MKRPSILFLATHPKEAASTRFRVLAYLPFLRQIGWEVTFDPFFSTESLEAINNSNRSIRTSRWILQGAKRRRQRLLQTNADLLFIHRELFPWSLSIGMSLLMPLIRKRGVPILFDFDDAVYLRHRQDRGWISRLENPAGIQSLMEASRSITAGNRQLAQYAARWNDQVTCLPTPVDTSQFTPASGKQVPAIPTLGWIGTPSTAKYLSGLLPLLRRLSRNCLFRLKVVGAGLSLGEEPFEIDQRPWRLNTEAEEFRSCDIGIYPLWDDEWSRGKCGYKALQFMSSGVPVVASAVGMNSEIFQDEANGFLARSGTQWMERLGQLIEDASLRARLGEAGRQTVEQRYALSGMQPKLLEILNQARASTDPIPVT